MSPGAQATHGITPKELASAPTFAEIYPKLESLLGKRNVLTYGADFDSGMITGELLAANLPLDYQYRWYCLMEQYAVWCGEWIEYWGSNYRWQPLCGSHRALGDCQAALSRLKAMADGTDEFTYPDWLVGKGLAVGVDLKLEQSDN